MSAAVRSSRPPHRSRRTQDNVLAALSDVVEISSDDNRSHAYRRGPAYSPPELSNSTSYAGAVPMTTAEPPLSSLPSSGNVASHNDPLNSGLPPPVPSKGRSTTFDSDHLSTSRSGMVGKFASAFKRQTAEEKEAKRRDKAQKNGQLSRSNTIGGSRMDVIDKLDASGIHGSSLFHHDSPYDACTPHANSSQRAPVKAFDPNTDPMTGLSISDGAGSGSRRPAANRVVSESGNKARPGRKRNDSLPVVASLPFDASSNQPARLPSGRQQYAPSDSTHDNASVTTASDADGHDRGYGGKPNVVKPNSAMAAMWGVQDDEPWQDFAAPKSSPRGKSGKKGSKANGSSRGAGNGAYLGPYDPRASRDGHSSATSSVLDMETLMTGQTAEEKRRAAEGFASPSQEIAGVSPFPEPDYDRGENDGAGSSGPKRNKSLLRRIKSARQNPNVPPPIDDNQVEMGSRAASKRYGPNSHRAGPSSPIDGPRSASTGRDWSNFTSPNLGAGSSAGNGTAASSGLVRNGTRRATKEEQARYFDAETGYNDAPRSTSARYPAVGGTGEGDNVGAAAADTGYFAAATQPGSGAGYLSPSERNQAARTPSGTQDSVVSPGLGRSGSLFGRFGRKGRSGERTPGY